MSITICAPPLIGMKILPQGSVGSGGSPAESYSVDVMSRRQRERRGVEEAARQLRYEAFAESGAQKTALAHAHAKTTAETVLMNLIRGSGTKGLAGMLPKNGNVIRPLLCCSEREIIDYMQDRGLQWVEDETNQDVEFTRNRNPASIDSHDRGAVESEFLCVGVPRSCHVAAGQRSFYHPWRELNISASNGSGGCFSFFEMTELPPALASRVARLFLEDVGHGRDIRFSHIQAILRTWQISRRDRRLICPGD